MKTKLRISILFLLIAATVGLLLRLIHTGVNLHNYKYLLHTHSHVALLGWLYNASIILLQYFVFKAQNDKVLNRIFWFSQFTFLGMLLSFPFQGYAFFSILFSTLYIFASYFLIYRLIKISSALESKTSAAFIKWGAFYLFLSSLGPFSLGVIMAKGLEESPLHDLAIYWFLHFLYNGFFVFVLFSYLSKFIKNERVARKVFLLMNSSIIPLYALSCLWLEANLALNIFAFAAAFIQIIAFFILAKVWEYPISFKSAQLLLYISALAYTLKLLFQLFASIPIIQVYINETISYSVIGFIHLVMIGFFSLFFLFVFIQERAIKENGLLKIGISVFLLGFIGSEFLLFSQSLLTYIYSTSIPNFNEGLFHISSLMPLGVLIILIHSLRE